MVAFLVLQSYFGEKHCTCWAQKVYLAITLSKIVKQRTEKLLEVLEYASS